MVLRSNELLSCNCFLKLHCCRMELKGKTHIHTIGCWKTNLQSSWRRGRIIITYGSHAGDISERMFSDRVSNQIQELLQHAKM